MLEMVEKALIGMIIALITLLVVGIGYHFAMPSVPGSGLSCTSWIAECASRRELAACRKDAHSLGCP